MSKFNKYAAKVDEIAKAAFEKYRAAEAAYKRAEDAAREYPQRMGVVDAQYAAKSARAHADFLDAKENMKAAKREFASHADEINALRNELAADVADTYSADPAQLDGNTLELLKSGILTGNEYARLLNKAQADNNPTMVRMIGKYAGEASKSRAENYGQYDKDAQAMRVVEFESRRNTGGEYLEVFDNMAELYGRCVNNPGMIDHWAEFTESTVENF